MKIYTKKGDKGVTSLFGGQRISKNSLRIKAYGTVDELNSILGQVRSGGVTSDLSGILKLVQNQLFTLGADLSTPPGSKTKIERMGNSEIDLLEKNIDSLSEQLPPLKNFILPGGTPAAATLHVARTVCRRAERHCIALLEEDETSDISVKYLNRLSDLLFVMARYENNTAGISDEAWKVE